MKPLLLLPFTLLMLSGCMSAAPDPSYRSFKCRELAKLSEDPQKREIQRVAARTDFARLNCAAR